MISIIDGTYEWINLSLIDFLNEGNIPSGWYDFFLQDSTQKMLNRISTYLEDEAKRKIIYPPIHQVFRAFYIVPLDNIKAVIIGQDCYHNGNAVGLCFSVKPGNSINPSLRNIYKELKAEGFPCIEDGDLTFWAKQGVLMLNMALTVEKGTAGSHSDIWEPFTRKLIKYISEKRKHNIDWFLFGKDAHSVRNILTGGSTVHLTSHPSPFAANKKCGEYPAFLGSGVFSKVSGIEWGKITSSKILL